MSSVEKNSQRIVSTIGNFATAANLSAEKSIILTLGRRKMSRSLKKGDYVLATKYRDGDSHDHFAVGFFDGMLIDNNGKITGRYLVVDEDGVKFRAGGFRRCEKISKDIGNLLVLGIPLVEQGCASVWYWRYHPQQLKELIHILR